MRNKLPYIWAYLDGKKLVEVIQAALDNNMLVDDVKKRLIAENPGHEVTFKVVTNQRRKNMNTKKWTDTLPADVYERLCNCSTIRADLPALVNAKWEDYKRRGKNDYLDKQDALVEVLELLDENGRDFYLSKDQWDALCK